MKRKKIIAICLTILTLFATLVVSISADYAIDEATSATKYKSIAPSGQISIIQEHRPVSGAPTDGYVISYEATPATIPLVPFNGNKTPEIGGEDGINNITINQQYDRQYTSKWIYSCGDLYDLEWDNGQTGLRPDQEPILFKLYETMTSRNITPANVNTIDNVTRTYSIRLTDVLVYGGIFSYKGGYDRNASIAPDIEFHSATVTVKDPDDPLDEDTWYYKDVPITMTNVVTGYQVLDTIGVNIYNHWSADDVDNEDTYTEIRLTFPQLQDNEIYKIDNVDIELDVQWRDGTSLGYNYGTREIAVFSVHSIYLNLDEYIRAKVAGINVDLPDVVDFGSWLGTSVMGFMNAEIASGVTLGGILIMVIAFCSVMWMLKLFAGG